MCNSGGFVWIPVGPLWITGPQPPDYQGGEIQRVDVASGAVETLYSTFPATDPVTKQPITLPLKGPDDLVFDDTGGFWFTDWGKSRMRDRDVTGVYYARPDGSSIREAIFPLDAPNGIALSPDGKRLYVAETYTRRVRRWELPRPGRDRPQPADARRGLYLLTAALPGQGILDSMKVDAEGNVWVATMLPNGADPRSSGGLTIVSPEGRDPAVPGDRRGTPDAARPRTSASRVRTAAPSYVTCGASGLLVKVRSNVAGHALAFGGGPA